MAAVATVVTAPAGLTDGQDEKGSPVLSGLQLRPSSAGNLAALNQSPVLNKRTTSSPALRAKASPARSIANAVVTSSSMVVSFSARQLSGSEDDDDREVEARSANGPDSGPAVVTNDSSLLTGPLGPDEAPDSAQWRPLEPQVLNGADVTSSAEMAPVASD